MAEQPLQALTELIQAPVRETVNFTFTTHEAPAPNPPVAVLMRINQGTRGWLGYGQTEAEAKAEVIEVALFTVQGLIGEWAMRSFLGMAPRPHNIYCDMVRDLLRVIRNLGRNGGEGFGPAIGAAYNCLNQVEISLIRQGHYTT